MLILPHYHNNQQIYTAILLLLVLLVTPKLAIGQTIRQSLLDIRHSLPQKDIEYGVGVTYAGNKNIISASANERFIYYKEYYPSGKLHLKACIDNRSPADRYLADCKSYHENGKLKAKYKKTPNKRITIVSYYSNGQKHLLWDSKKEEVVVWFKNGALQVKGQYSAEHVMFGNWTLGRKDGTKIYEDYYLHPKSPSFYVGELPNGSQKLHLNLLDQLYGEIQTSYHTDMSDMFHVANEDNEAFHLITSVPLLCDIPEVLAKYRTESDSLRQYVRLEWGLNGKLYEYQSTFSCYLAAADRYTDGYHDGILMHTVYNAYYNSQDLIIKEIDYTDSTQLKMLEYRVFDKELYPYLSEDTVVHYYELNPQKAFKDACYCTRMYIGLNRFGHHYGENYSDPQINYFVDAAGNIWDMVRSEYYRANVLKMRLIHYAATQEPYLELYDQGNTKTVPLIVDKNNRYRSGDIEFDLGDLESEPDAFYTHNWDNLPVIKVLNTFYTIKN